MRWEQSYRLLELVSRRPDVSAEELQIEGASIGIEISLRTAYRFLQRYRHSGGEVLNYPRTHLGVVSEILKNDPEGRRYSPLELRQAALLRGVSLHLSTVYRILQKLVLAGTVVQFDEGGSGRVLYQWLRTGAEAQGTIICIVCGRTVAFEKSYLNSLAMSICSHFNYEHERMEFVLHAYCPDCRSSQ